MNKITIPAIKVSQPIGEFFFGTMKAKELVDISFSDVRKMSREVEDYLGIQRELKKSRVKDIKEYISTLDSTFPNSIIIAIKGKYAEYRDNTLILTFDDFEKDRVAKILDGQHRLAGFDSSNFNFTDELGIEKPFELLVTIFVEADISVQAKVFAMVNQNQTKVNPSLVYDLESLSTSRSPSKTAHQIAVLLNGEQTSPFYRRIKRLGIKSDGVDKETLTQAAFVDNLVKLISPKPKEDRNILLGKSKGFFGFGDKKLSYMEDNYLHRCVFRECFAKEKDEIIALNFANYFSAIKECWPIEWENNNSISVLNKTIGFIAFTRFMRVSVNVIREFTGYDSYREISVNQYKFILSSTKIPADYFYSVDAVSKSSGQIYNKLNDRFLSEYRDRSNKILRNKLTEILLGLAE